MRGRVLGQEGSKGVKRQMESGMALLGEVGKARMVSQVVLKIFDGKL